MMSSTPSLLGVAAVLCSLFATTPTVAAQQSNTGSIGPPTGEHVLSSFALPWVDPVPRDPGRFVPESRAGELQTTNLGELSRPVFAGHDLTEGPAPVAVPAILYAPSEADDLAFRSAVSLAAGGAIVDYFDARFATPDLALLLQYDAVYTWANYGYDDNVLFGDVLADYNDLGGNVVLGVFCTYTTGYYLDGRIMTPGYSPVWSPTGTNHKASDDYAGDGFYCIYNGVGSLESFYRDFLTLQGTGQTDGTYVDGEICHAFRPDPGGIAGDVVYSNGCGAFPLFGTGDWPQAVANSALCNTGLQTRILYAPSALDDPALRAAIAFEVGGAVVDYFDASFATPPLALLTQYDAVYTWADFAYADNVLFGDLLADYNDLGGHVVLGAFCTYTSGNFLDGRIMTPDYCPVVSPTGSNHYLWDSYAGDGKSCIYGGVATLDSTFRDVLVTQGRGVADGTYFDGEICHAYRPSAATKPGAVVYSNGIVLSGGGDWARAVANVVTCEPGVGLPAATCTFRNPAGVNPADFWCTTPPVLGDVWYSTVDTTALLGTMTLSTFVGASAFPTQGIPVFGWEMLVLPPFDVLDPGFGAHAIAIPPLVKLVGAPVASQAVRVELGTTGMPLVILANGQDLVLGY